VRAEYGSRKNDRAIHLAPFFAICNPDGFPRRCFSVFLALKQKRNAAEARIFEPELLRIALRKQM